MSFGKPSWKLVEVKDQAEADPDVEDDQGHKRYYDLKRFKIVLCILDLQRIDEVSLKESDMPLMQSVN